MDGEDMACVKLAALSRRFQVGEFYDYRTDQVLKELKPVSEFSNLPTTRNDAEFKLQLFRPVSETSNKYEHMGLDEHLQASILAGLIDSSKYKGAAHYLNDQSNPSQVTRTLVCRAMSKEEHVDVRALLISEGQETMPKATHVVAGIIYGAEAYCVLTQDFNEADLNSKEDAEESLSKISSKMEDALEDLKDVAYFKEEFTREEKLMANGLKCRVYADMQTEPVRECNVFDAYKHCLKLIDQVKNLGVRRNGLVQISIILCPLKFASSTVQNSLLCRDVNAELIARCCRIWTKFEQVNAKAGAIRAASKFNRASFSKFTEVVGKFQDLVKKRWKNGVMKSRQDEDPEDKEVEKAASIAETHPLFKFSRLKQWLCFKQAELDMVNKMSSFDGITVLAGKLQLETELANSFDKKFALVLNIPQLDEQTNAIFSAMKEYVDSYSRLVAVDEDDKEEDAEDETKLPWHMVTRRRKLVMDKISEMAEHVTKNKHIEKQVQFFIVPDNSGKKFGYHYSIYQAEKLLKDNLNQLPTPPTGLRIQTVATGSIKRPRLSTLPIQLKWNYEPMGYPCSFLVEYRPIDDSDGEWKQQKTSKPGETQMVLTLRQETSFEVRVAAETCIGRSLFCQVVDVDSALAEQIVDVEDEVSVKEADTSTTKRKSVRLKLKAETVQVQVKQELTPWPSSSTDVAIPQEITTKEALLPPTELQLDFVTATTAEISWEASKTSATSDPFSYGIRFTSASRPLLHDLTVDSQTTSCLLEDLHPGTTYSVNVVAISDDGQQRVSSDVMEFTTQLKETRFAENLLKIKKCKKLGNRNGMDLYGVPVTKTSRVNSPADRYAFGRAENKRNGRKQHRTILVMGATGAGKTTLINGMINFIFNVEWQDPFRFQLIQEQTVGRSQVDSQTSKITAYDIHHMEGFRISYSLTIVDTPGYGDTKGLERDQEITEMVRKFFEDKKGIQELDVVGFVAQASLPRLTPTQIYIFDSVLSIFGKDVEENINFLLTFADSQNPPVLSAIGEAGLPCPVDAVTKLPVHHKFNNSGFFCSSRESGSGSGPTSTVDRFNRFFWRMGMENFQRFFNGLAAMKTKSLSLTKQVLEERKQLEATVDGLQPLIKIGLGKMEEMRKTEQMISNSQAKIDLNQNVTFEVESTKAHQVQIPNGQYLTNCNKCFVTCHNPCSIRNDDGKMKCSAMDHSLERTIRTCVVCPKRCIWYMHSNQSYKWEYVLEKQAISSDEIKAKYEAELKKKLTAQDLVKVLKDALEENERAVLQKVETVTRCIKRLDEIALRPNPFSTPQYIDLIINAEKQEKKLGFEQRIESLKKLRQMAVVTTKIKNKESLLDQKDDLAMVPILGE